MEKTYKAFVALVLNEGFNILVYKNAFVYFKVTYSHETSKYLALILLWGLCLQYLIKKKKVSPNVLQVKIHIFGK